MKKFEYKTILFREYPWDEDLNELGADGWSVVGTMPSKIKGIAILFQREVGCAPIIEIDETIFDKEINEKIRQIHIIGDRRVKRYGRGEIWDYDVANVLLVDLLKELPDKERLKYLDEEIVPYTKFVNTFSGWKEKIERDTERERRFKRLGKETETISESSMNSMPIDEPYEPGEPGDPSFH